jgi:dTDP-glucose pyrophosphorylase
VIVIPMAGESSRFRRAGYTRPKYMLDLGGRPLWDWTLLSFRALFATELFLFVARDVDGTADFLRERLATIGIARAEIIILDAPTSGQAETVSAGLARATNVDDGALTIFNIDTIRPNYNPPSDPAILQSDGWLEVFKGEGDGWSFVEPDSERPHIVARTTEKIPISDLCCTGLYAFRSASLFQTALSAEKNHPSSPELYVAPIYNHLIAAGHSIAYAEIDKDQVLFSGVPEEYEALRANRSDLASSFRR